MGQRRGVASGSKQAGRAGLRSLAWSGFCPALNACGATAREREPMEAGPNLQAQRGRGAERVYGGIHGTTGCCPAGVPTTGGTEVPPPPGRPPGNHEALDQPLPEVRVL